MHRRPLPTYPTVTPATESHRRRQSRSASPCLRAVGDLDLLSSASPLSGLVVAEEQRRAPKAAARHLPPPAPAVTAASPRPLTRLAAQDAHSGPHRAHPLPPSTATSAATPTPSPSSSALSPSSHRQRCLPPATEVDDQQRQAAELDDTHAMLGHMDESIACYEKGLQIQMSALDERNPCLPETCR